MPDEDAVLKELSKNQEVKEFEFQQPNPQPVVESIPVDSRNQDVDVDMEQANPQSKPGVYVDILIFKN